MSFSQLETFSFSSSTFFFGIVVDLWKEEQEILNYGFNGSKLATISITFSFIELRSSRNSILYQNNLLSNEPSHGSLKSEIFHPDKNSAFVKLICNSIFQRRLKRSFGNLLSNHFSLIVVWNGKAEAIIGFGHMFRLCFSSRIEFKYFERCEHLHYYLAVVAETCSMLELWLFGDYTVRCIFEFFFLLFLRFQ